MLVYSMPTWSCVSLMWEPIRSWLAVAYESCGMLPYVQLSHICIRLVSALLWDCRNVFACMSRLQHFGFGAF